MPILTKSGRVVIAESIKLRNLHMAWGSGDGAWLTPAAESPDTVALMSEVGRRMVDTVDFVAPDEGGAIILPSGAFSLSGAPTNHIYLKTKFTFTDAPSAVIRELAIFAGTEVVAGLPAGQRYFEPAQVTNPGRMIHIQHFQPIYRSIAVEESFEVVISF